MEFGCRGRYLPQIFRGTRLWYYLVLTLILLLPVPPNAGAAATGASRGEFKYTVKQGDCLWLIARRYQTTVEALKLANNLRSEKLRPGQILRIPSTRNTRVFGRGANPVVTRSPLPSRSGDVIRDLLDYARSLLGTPYRWAGESPAAGFDCSGFTKHVFGRFGISLPHSAAAQSTCGIPVSRSELLPGDLLLFRTSGRGIDHAAIYLGDGRFIHASSRGGCVRLDSLGEPYWSSHFVGARRLLGSSGGSGSR